MATDAAGQQIVIRDAHANDTMALAQLAMLAGHGLFEIFYGGLIPGLSTLETIARRRIEWPGGFSETKRWKVAEDAVGNTLGALNSFPREVFESANPDPLVAERLASRLMHISNTAATGRLSPKRFSADMRRALPCHAEQGLYQSSAAALSLLPPRLELRRA
jgi:hypothetical protein